MFRMLFAQLKIDFFLFTVHSDKSYTLSISVSVFCCIRTESEKYIFAHKRKSFRVDKVEINAKCVVFLSSSMLFPHKKAQKKI